MCESAYKVRPSYAQTMWPLPVVKMRASHAGPSIGVTAGLGRCECQCASRAVQVSGEQRKVLSWARYGLMRAWIAEPCEAGRAMPMIRRAGV
jgi:hypothetical protein